MRLRILICYVFIWGFWVWELRGRRRLCCLWIQTDVSYVVLNESSFGLHTNNWDQAHISYLGRIIAAVIFCGGGGFSELTGGLSALHCSVYLSPKSETHPIVSEISLLSRFRESINIAHEFWWLCYLRSFNGHYNIIIY